MASAGTRAASGCRRPARNHAFIAYWRVPSPPPGTTPGPSRGRLHIGGMGVLVVCGPVGRTRFRLGGGRSRCSLLRALYPSSSLPVVRVARAFVSGHPSQGRAQSGWAVSPWLAADRRIPGRHGGGAGLRGRSALGPSINELERRAGGWDQNNIRNNSTVDKSTEISILILYSRPVRPVHSTCFTPRQVSTLLRTLPRRNLRLRSSATLHVVGPDVGVAPVVRACFLGRPSQVRQPPMASESPWSEAPARRPVLLETWCRGLPGPRSIRPFRPSDVAGSRAHLSAAHVGGGVVSFKFVVASRSESPRSPIFGPLALRRSARDGATHDLPGRARNGLAWPGAYRVPQAQSCPSNVSHASRQYPWRLTTACRASR